MEQRGYFFYLDGVHICVNDTPCVRSQLPAGVRVIAGPYPNRDYPLSGADEAAHLVLRTQ